MATKISELPTGQRVGNILNETLNVGGGATTATTATVTIPRTTATTNTVEPLLALNRQSSGTPANGIGASLVFDVETAAGNTERGATIEAVTTDVTAASEDFAIVLKAMVAGAAATEHAQIRTVSGVGPGIFPTTAWGNTSVGIVGHTNGDLILGSQSTSYARMSPYSAGGDGNSAFNLAAATKLSWASSAGAANTSDTAIRRSSAAGIQVTNSNTTIGTILVATLVEANTAGSGSPNILTGLESRTLLTNEGATAQNYHTLPTAVAGLDFEFVVQDSDGIRVVAAAGDTIQDVGTVSAAAGYIQSTTIGSVIRLKAINATQWVVMSKMGTWTVDS